jgi:hypothetical protein
MKSLVYENYDKFISATDTMRQVSAYLLIYMTGQVTYIRLINAIFR